MMAASTATGTGGLSAFLVMRNRQPWDHDSAVVHTQLTGPLLFDGSRGPVTARAFLSKRVVRIIHGRLRLGGASHPRIPPNGQKAKEGIRDQSERLSLS